MPVPQGRAAEFHGARGVVPPGWEDFTVFKFAAPEQAELDLPLLMKAASKPKPKFRSNLVVTKHRVPEQIPLELIFTGPNTVSREQNPAFKVARSGLATYQGQPAAWQDVEFFDPGVQLQIFQRQVATRTAPQDLVMFTLTTTQDKLDDLSRSLGFETPGEGGK
jgi:hypothetical protein